MNLHLVRLRSALLVLTLLCGDGIGQTGTASGLVYDLPWPASISGGLDPGGRITTAATSGTDGGMVCTLQISLTTAGPGTPNSIAYSRTYSIYDRTGTSCFGVPSPTSWGGGTTQDNEAFFESVKNATRGLPLTAGSPGSSVGSSGSPHCSGGLWIHNPGGNRPYQVMQQVMPQSECRSAPAVAACTIGTTSDLVHATLPAGQVTSTEKSVLYANCSRPTVLTVAIPSPGVRLDGTGGTVMSGLWVGSPGVTSARVNANPTGAVELLSQIDSNIAMAGVYQGSTVVTVSWD